MGASIHPSTFRNIIQLNRKSIRISFKMIKIFVSALSILTLAGQLTAVNVQVSLTGQTCPEVWDGTEVFLPSKSNCEEYFQCVHGVPVLMQCPDGLYWDQSKQICNWPDEVSPPCTAECKKPWVRADWVGNCYLLGTEEMNYNDAQKFCTDNGGILAEPRSSKETRAINNKIERHGNGENYWIGLTDTEKEKTFVWGSDQAEVTYSNWYGREPNNAGNEDCVHIRPKKLSQWNDSKCGQKRSSQGPNTALCQKF